MEPLGFQNGARGLQNGARGFQNEPGASKMAPSWSRIDQDGDLEVLGHPREPSRPLGSGLGGSQAAKIGAKGPQGTPKAPKMVPKWGQNWVQNRSKMVSDSECSKMSIFDRFFDEFSIKKTGLNLIDSAKIWCLD